MAGVPHFDPNFRRLGFFNRKSGRLPVFDAFVLISPGAICRPRLLLAVHFRSMPKVSAGLLLYRFRDGRLQVLLVHPGGPFFRNKDLGAWSIPKGEPDEGEPLLEVAKREFREETGFVVDGEYLELTAVKQKAGKVVHAWALEGDCDPAALRSNTFPLEWPPRSGKRVEFPEVDRAEFFELETAREKINPAQSALLEELQRRVGSGR
jgi:predicted NUDIX family NTP pyrophosphohydrolase